MFGRRFPFFLPSNWCRGIWVFKGEGVKKASGESRGEDKPTELPSCPETKLDFNGSLLHESTARVIKMRKWGRATIITRSF